MIKKCRIISFALASLFLGVIGLSLASPENERKVYVIPVQDGAMFIVDLGLASFVRRAVLEAEQAQAEAIILEIKTFGGRVDAAVEIRDILLETDIKTIALVRRGISAGALIALSCQSIVMSPGSTIGAATPVAFAGEEPQPVSEKKVSVIRAEFRATAKRNRHPTHLAEAMVDADIELVAVTIEEKLYLLTPEELERKKEELGEEKIRIEKVGIPVGFAPGKLVTLTAEEALKFGLASAKVSEPEEILPLYGLEGASLVRVPITWSENLVRFLTHPIISGLLLTLGMLGLVFELRIPGWGIGGTIGLACLALFFGGRFLAGMAEWMMVLIPILFLGGIALLALEIFVIPGFGIAGIGGAIMITGSIFLALVGEPPSPLPGLERRYWEALQIMSYSLIAAFLVIVLSLRFIPQTRLWRRVRHRLVLIPTQASEQGYRGTPDTWEKFLGQEGMTTTILRPAGRARFGEELLDVVTEGEFIPAGEKVKVVKVEGNRIIIAEVET